MCAIGRREGIEMGFQALNSIVDKVFPVDQKDIIEAHRICLSFKELSARDSLHVSIMRRYKIKKIFSFDSDFDIIPNLERIPG